MSQTIDQVYRDYNTQGVPASGEHEPDKREIRALLKMIQNSGGQAVTRNTLSALNGVTPPTEDYMGVVLADPTASNNGYYYRSGSAWVFGRPFPDTFAEVALSGSGTAQTGAVDTGVNPSGVEVFFARVTTPNTGPMTLSISGEAARDVVNLAGNPLSAGEWTGIVMFDLNEDGDYQLLIDAGAAAAAAASASFSDERADDAEAAAVRAENAAASFSEIGTNFKTVANLLADTTVGYTGSGADTEVDAGDVVTAQGFRYEVAASDATDEHVETADGVKLYALPLGGVLYDVQFGLPLNGDWNGGGTDAAAQLQKWASATGANIKAFTGVSLSSTAITFPIDVVLIGGGHEVGIDFTGATSLPANTCVLIDGTANLVQISNLAGNVTKGDRTITLGGTGEVEPRDFLCIYNPTPHSYTAGDLPGSRAEYVAGEWGRVQSEATGVVTLFAPLWEGYSSADVEVYRLRGGGPVVRGFRIKPPYDSVAALTIDCAVRPIVENLRLDGSKHAALVMRRCMDEYVNCQLFQLTDDGTPSTEYALSHLSCFGGEVHGDYYAQRHGIAFGNGTGPCFVPNRNTRVFANTSSSLAGAGSLDFGHGCNQNLQAIGGTHTGVSLGGKGNRYTGITIRSGGYVVNGSEIYEGDFIFSDCVFEGFGANAVAQVVIAIQAAATGNARFIFAGCTFDVDPADEQAIRISTTNYAHKPSLIISNPRVRRGDGLNQLALLRNAAGTLVFEEVAVTGVTGLPDTVARVLTTGAQTCEKYRLDGQIVNVTATPATTSSTVTATANWPWPYPSNVNNFFPRVTHGSRHIGDKIYTAWTSTATATGISLGAQTVDGANFSSTTAGTLRCDIDVN